MNLLISCCLIACDNKESSNFLSAVIRSDGYIFSSLYYLCAISLQKDLDKYSFNNLKKLQALAIILKKLKIVYPNDFDVNIKLAEIYCFLGEKGEAIKVIFIFIFLRFFF